MPQSKQNPAPPSPSTRDPEPGSQICTQSCTQISPEIRHAASAAIFNARGVLIVRRGRPPLEGQWSLPGGHALPGETPASAAIREVSEEAGIAATIIAHVGRHIVEVTGDDGRQRRYLIEVHAGSAPDDAEPVAGDDASDARFVALLELNRYALTTGAAELIAKAAEQLRTAGQLSGANLEHVQIGRAKTAGSAAP